jgi:hypothetical protein
VWQAFGILGGKPVCNREQSNITEQAYACGTVFSVRVICCTCCRTLSVCCVTQPAASAPQPCCPCNNTPTLCPVLLPLFAVVAVRFQGDLLHVLSHPERVLRHTASSISTTIVVASATALSTPLLSVLLPCLLWLLFTLQGDLLHVLSHPERVLRHTAGSISTTIVGALGLAGWPELVHWLLGSLGSGAAGEGPALDGALDSLSKVVEDHPHQVCAHKGGLRGGGQKAGVGCW